MLLWNHMLHGFLSKGVVLISGVVLYTFSYVAGAMHSVLIKEARAFIKINLHIVMLYYTTKNIFQMIIFLI